jgi:ketosteroid isomerase-like protein
MGIHAIAGAAAGLLLLVLTPMNAMAQDRAADIASDIAPVVAAERAFRADVARDGVRRGFLANADDDAVIFRPNAVNAKDFLAAGEDQPGLLEWEPAFADVSLAGDLGFTTGPWTLRETVQDTVIAAGTYATVWRRGADGVWRFLIDLGARGPELIAVPQPMQVIAAQRDSAAAPAPAPADTAALVGLMRFERGLGSAELLAHVRDDARMLRRMSPAIVGRSAIEAFVAVHGLPRAVEPVGGSVARSGDLAYTYGRYAMESGEEGNYLRVWRRGTDDWTLLFEVLSPLPPQPKK